MDLAPKIRMALRKKRGRDMSATTACLAVCNTRQGQARAGKGRQTMFRVIDPIFNTVVPYIDALYGFSYSSNKNLNSKF